MAQDSEELTLFSREFKNLRESTGLSQQQLHQELLKRGIKIEDGYINDIECGLSLPKDFIVFLSTVLLVLCNPVTSSPANAQRLFMGTGDTYTPSAKEQKLLKIFRSAPQHDKEKILSFLKKINQD